MSVYFWTTAQWTPPVVTWHVVDVDDTTVGEAEDIEPTDLDETSDADPEPMQAGRAETDPEAEAPSGVQP